MFPFPKRKKKNQKPTPQWVIWLVLGFVVYSVITGNNTPHIQPEQNKGDQPADLAKTQEPAQNTQTNKPNTITIANTPLFDFSAIAGKMSPQVTIRLSVQDNEAGEGEPAICGQKVTVRYDSFTADNKEIEKKQETTFIIGDKTAIPAIEQGVPGMKKNGKRTITSPGNLAYGDEKFLRNDVPALADIRFEAELLASSPAIPDSSAFRVIGDGTGNSDEQYYCGSKAKVHVAIWNVEGKKLYDSRSNGGEPLSFTIGKSEVFLGLDQGVMQMVPEMRRNLIVPPGLQKTLNGNEPAINFPLPNNQTVLVDIEAMP